MPVTYFRRSGIAFLAFIVAGLAACESSRDRLVMVSPASDIDLQISTELQSLLSRKSDFRIGMTENRMSGEEALDALVAGRADIALVSNLQPYRDGVATVMPLYPTVLHIAYRKGLDASDPIGMLRGADVYAGAEGSASRIIFESITASSGLKDGDFRFTDGRFNAENQLVDVAVAFAPITPGIEDEFAGYEFLTLGSPDDIGTGSTADAAALINPRLRPFVIPVGTYGDATPRPILTMAVDKMLIARSDVDPSLIYDLIGEILRLRPALSADHPALFDKLRDDYDIGHSTFVLHKGAQNFLRRMQPSVYERYSGMADVFITILIATISAGVAGVRIWKRRRKNRIDEYYAEAIRIRDTINDSSNDDDKRAAAEELLALQDDAFRQLIGEKLDADESFRIFITLSDDILATLK